MDTLQLTGISVHWIDLAIMGTYIVGILIAGVYLTRAASRGFDSFLLGGR